MSRDAVFPWLCLSLAPGLGPRRGHRLVQHFGSAAECWQAVCRKDPELKNLLPAGTRRQLLPTEVERRAEQVLRRCEASGWQVICLASAEYPHLLAQIPDPPLVLYLWGTLTPEDAWSLAIVGTRHATAYGKLHAHRLAQALAQAGMTIISGLARGVDAAAHQGALDASGRTLGVLAGGLDQVAPRENRSLARQIADRGAVVSEQPPGVAPRGELFPVRNRIISGLSLGVLVVEADQRSGALITATHALEQGREVFALPGPVQNRTSRGPHRLLREGAHLVESPQDVLQELTTSPLLAAGAAAARAPAPTQPAPTAQTPSAPEEPPAGKDDPRVPLPLAASACGESSDPAMQVLQTLQQQGGPCTVDQLVAASGLPAGQVLAALNLLELQGRVQRSSGQLIQPTDAPSE